MAPLHFGSVTEWIALVDSPASSPDGHQDGADLFADENKYAGGQRHKVEQENGRSEVQAEPQKAVDDQVNPEQKRADVFGEFHDANAANCILGLQSPLSLI
jgi:hypothetical protein